MSGGGDVEACCDIDVELEIINFFTLGFCLRVFVAALFLFLHGLLAVVFVLIAAAFSAHGFHTTKT